MAKKKKRRAKKCRTENCLFHKFWPAIEAAFHPVLGQYWVDKETAEILIATGLKALSDGQVVPIDENTIEPVHVRCDCGNEASVRSDLLYSGRVDRCPQCAALSAEAKSN